MLLLYSVTVVKENMRNLHKSQFSWYNITKN